MLKKPWTLEQEEDFQQWKAEREKPIEDEEHAEFLDFMEVEFLIKAPTPSC